MILSRGRDRMDRMKRRRAETVSLRVRFLAGRAGAGRTMAERDRLSYAGEDGMRSGGGNSAGRDFLEDGRERGSGDGGMRDEPQRHGGTEMREEPRTRRLTAESAQSAEKEKRET